MHTVKLVLIFLSVLCKINGENFELLILHNNDMHGRFDETSKTSSPCNKQPCYGGFARTFHYINEARQKAATGTGPPVLYLNAGDTYTGTIWFQIFKWDIAADFMNVLMPDAASLGNHEFDLGVKGLLPFINQSNFPIITSNLDLSEEPELKASKLKKSVIIERGGQKIGIIGFLTPDTQFIASTGKVKFLDEIDAIKTESEMLQEQGINIIIAVGHSGFEKDKEIAAKVPLVDVVIGGHTNTFLYNGKVPDREQSQGPYPTVITQSSGKNVPVVQAYAYTKYIGELRLTFDDKGNVLDYSGQPVLLDSSKEQDKTVLEKLKTYRPYVEEAQKRIVGKTKVFLRGELPCRRKECNMGNLITDAAVAHHVSHLSQKLWTDAPIAIVNGGGIRISIDAKNVDGNVSMADIMDVLPFSDSFEIVSLKGKYLKEALEGSVGEKYDAGDFGGFLQFSGLQVTYNLNKPHGSRVVKALARCGPCSIPIYEPLQDNDTYRILMPSFLTSGGDSHNAIKNNVFNKTLAEYRDSEVLSKYIEQKSPVFPEEHERIIFVNGATAHFKSNNFMSFMLFTVLLNFYK